MISRKEIKQAARIRSAQTMGLGIGAYILFLLITGMAAIPGVVFGAIIVGWILTVSYSALNIDIFTENDPNIATLFNKAFDRNFGRKLGGMAWRDLFIFLWGLLFIIPGLIKTLSYFMVPYILANDPDVTAKDATKISMKMMHGHKWELFVFYLSYLGWDILSCLTCGILHFVFVARYKNTALAGFAMEIRENAIRTDLVKIDGTGHIVSL